MADAPYTPNDAAAGANGGGGSPYGPYMPPAAAISGPSADQQAAAMRAASAAPPAALAPPAPLAPRGAPQPSTTMTPQEEQLQRESTGSRVYHGIMSALGGKYDTQYIPTPNGVVQQQVAQTPGQQWKRIISGALLGLGGAAAAGTTGPGGTMRGLGAGIQAGYQGRIQEDKSRQQQANTQFEQDQSAAMQKAQRSMMTMELAQKTFALQRSQVEATTADIERSNQFNQLIHQGGSGSRSIGHYATPDEAYAAAKENPNMHDDIAHGRIVVMPHIENGKINGVDAAYVSDNWLDTPTSEDIPISYKITGPDGKLMEVHHTIPAGALKQGQAMDVLNRLSTTQMEDHWKEIEADFKKQELKNQTEELHLRGQAEAREAQAFPLEQQKRQLEITALQSKDPYSDARLAWGSFNPEWAPVSHYPRGTPGIDITAVKKGLDGNDQKVELLSNNIVSNADEVSKILTDPKRYPALSGPMDGRLTQFKQWLGTNNPDVSAVKAFIHNLAMATVGIHGSRSKGNVDETQDIIMRDFLNGPAAVQGAIDANVHSAQDFQNQIENKRIYGTYTGPDRSKQIKYDAQGAPLTEQQAAQISGTAGGPAQNLSVSYRDPKTDQNVTKYFTSQEQLTAFKKAAGIP